MSWTGPDAADGVADGVCKSLPVVGDAGVGTEALRFFNSAGVGAPRFRTGRSKSSSASGAAGGGAEAAGAVAGAGRFSTGRSESPSASGAAGGVDPAGAVAGVG